jgi:hypothetical protein
MTLAKRPISEVEKPASTEAKKICTEGPSISHLLDDIESEFRRREDEKKKAFMKWANDGR